jgi:cytochrome c553
MKTKAALFTLVAGTKIPLALLLCLSILITPVSAWSQGSAATRAITPAERSALSPSRSMLELGKDVAATACASCHGKDGISTAEAIPHIAGQRTVYLHRVLQGYRGRERHHDAMNQATGFLNADALLAVSAYYASLAPARPAPASDETVEIQSITSADPFFGIRGAMKKCSKCHGEDGNSKASGMPSLTAQSAEYFMHYWPGRRHA